MEREKVELHVIFLRSNGVLLSKKHYNDWREIQNEHDDYMASLGPWSLADTLLFFGDQWGADESRWPFSTAQVERFAASEKQVLQDLPR